MISPKNHPKNSLLYEQIAFTVPNSFCSNYSLYKMSNCVRNFVLSISRNLDVQRHRLDCICSRHGIDSRAKRTAVIYSFGRRCVWLLYILLYVQLSSAQLTSDNMPVASEWIVWTLKNLYKIYFRRISVGATFIMVARAPNPFDLKNNTTIDFLFSVEFFFTPQLRTSNSLADLCV